MYERRQTENMYSHALPFIKLLQSVWLDDVHSKQYTHVYEYTSKNVDPHTNLYPMMIQSGTIKASFLGFMKLNL